MSRRQGLRKVLALALALWMSPAAAAGTPAGEPFASATGGGFGGYGYLGSEIGVFARVSGGLTSVFLVDLELAGGIHHAARYSAADTWPMIDGRAIGSIPIVVGQWGMGPAFQGFMAAHADLGWLGGGFGPGVRVERIDRGGDGARWEGFLGADIGVYVLAGGPLAGLTLDVTRRTRSGWWLGARVGLRRTGIEVGRDLAFGRWRRGELR